MLIVSLFLAACQSDEEQLVPRPAVITFGAAKGGVAWIDGRVTGNGGASVASRASVAPRGSVMLPRDADTKAAAVTPENMGVFAYGDKEDVNVFDNQRVFFVYSKEFSDKKQTWDYWNKSDTTGLSPWPYYTGDDNEPQRLWQKMAYRFLAYSPWRENGVSVSEKGYNFDTFTWTDIHEYSAHDHIVAKEIVTADNSDGKRKTSEVVTFEMQHLMARIRLFVKMNAGYRTIRRIELNSITVTTAGKQRDATFTFTYNGTNNTLSNVQWSADRAGAPESVELMHESGLAYDLPTKYDKKPFSSIYVLPQDSFSGLTLTFDYSVFDSKGVKTRESEVTNTIDIPNWHLIEGRYYDIKINVAPDFLYVLSDNDQESDGVVIIKDK